MHNKDDKLTISNTLLFVRICVIWTFGFFFVFINFVYCPLCVVSINFDILH